MDFPFYGLLCLLLGTWGAAFWRRFALTNRWIRQRGGASLVLAYLLMGLFLPLPWELLLPPFLALLPLPPQLDRWSLQGLAGLGLGMSLTLGPGWIWFLPPGFLLLWGLQQAGQAWAWRSWAGVLWIPAFGGLGLWAEFAGKAVEASILFYGIALALTGLLLVGRRPLPLGAGPWRFLALLYIWGVSLLSNNAGQWLAGVLMLALLLLPLARPWLVFPKLPASRKGKAFAWMGMQAGLVALALVLIHF